MGLSSLLLFLEKTVDLEPVGSSAVSGARLGHADDQALAEAASFAGGSVLLVNDAFAVVLAFGDGVQVVVRASEERLQRKRRNHLVKRQCNGINRMASGGIVLSNRLCRPTYTNNRMAYVIKKKNY